MASDLKPKHIGGGRWANKPEDPPGPHEAQLIRIAEAIGRYFPDRRGQDVEEAAVQLFEEYARHVVTRREALQREFVPPKHHDVIHTGPMAKARPATVEDAMNALQLQIADIKKGADLLQESMVKRPNQFNTEEMSRWVLVLNLAKLVTQPPTFGVQSGVTEWSKQQTDRITQGIQSFFHQVGGSKKPNHGNEGDGT